MIRAYKYNLDCCDEECEHLEQPHERPPRCWLFNKDLEENWLIERCEECLNDDKHRGGTK